MPCASSRTSGAIRGRLYDRSSSMGKLQLETRVRLKKILFLTDFSWASDTAIPFIREIAEQYEAKVIALHVVVPDPLHYMTPESPSVAIESQNDFALAEMTKVEAQLAGIPNQVVVTPCNDVWSLVRSMLQAEHIDLILVGTHGRTGLPYHLTAST